MAATKSYLTGPEELWKDKIVDNLADFCTQRQLHDEPDEPDE